MCEKIEDYEELNNDEEDWDDVPGETESWSRVMRRRNRDRFGGRSIFSAKTESFHDMFWCQIYHEANEKRNKASSGASDGAQNLKIALRVNHSDRGLCSLN